uniref:Flagellar hook-associated protein 1 n=1 Tax=Candidatus Desulfatibia profunda TaxID=2841695 RepID=A0A8J6TH52_9BACT|nr:flagellar hook-associated protein FlgK [Candidatus Desulfatibia profunda]
MSLGLVLDIAKTALAAQKYALNVTGHNIANVNTPGYSRQSPIMEAQEPSTYAGKVMGRGVLMNQIVRVCDQFIEDRLMQEKSSMFSSKEMENYMQILESSFSENSTASISSILSDFWNMWHDVSNNPSGVPERIALYEHSMLLAEQFNKLDADLGQMTTDLTAAVSVGIEKANEITAKIAQLNDKIVRMGANSSANDLWDMRNTLISELSEYLDVKTFAQDNGSLTVVTAMGYILVHANTSFDLQMGGAGGDQVQWLGSNGETVDITDYITSGKMGGWLDMRDEIVAKYNLDLDAVVKEFTWTVNQQHSQGIGQAGFTSVTGTYSATAPAAAITASGLSYQDKVDDSNKTFKIWLYDTNGDPYDSDLVTAGLQGNPITITVTSGMTINELVTAIDNGTGVQASLDSQNRVTISINTGEIATLGSLAFSEDNSNVLAALGINTFFQGAGAGSISINSVISNKDYIATAQIDANGNYTAGDNSNALAMIDLQYASTAIAQWTCDRINGNTQGSITTTIEGYYHAMAGSIGITSASITSSRAFNEAMVNKLSGIRDSISAVSLDEEMTNLIKFQHAYTAAAKLVSVADEMMATLLQIK